MLILDSLYLKTFEKYFRNQIKNVQQDKLKIKPYSVILAYLFLIFGMKYFVINKNFTDIETFLFGLVIYGVYETTNMAIFTNWTFKSFVIDTIWGGILFYLTNKISKQI